MRAVLCGYYGMGNGGDEALLASLVQLLPSTVTPIVLSGSPQATAQQLGVEVCDRKSLPAVVNAIRQADAFIWGGGSLVQDATSRISPLYYTGLMTWAQQLGKVTIAWAQGIGPLHHRSTRWVARHAFARCTAVSVRDAGSSSLLQRWAIPHLMAPDPVWAMTTAPVAGLADLPAPRVAVALRPHTHLTDDRLQAIIQALQWFQQATDTYVLLVPFQPAKDRIIAEHIQAQMPSVSKVVSLDTPQQLKGLFQGVEMTIAMRFHGLIMAAAEASRCFALSYDPKVQHLMTDLDLPGWSLEQMPQDPRQICQAWLECYANQEALAPAHIQSLVDRALMHQDLLHQTLR